MPKNNASVASRPRYLGAAFDGLIDEIGELGNLLRRCKDQIDRLVDLALDRVEGDDTGLADPRPDMAADVNAASASGCHIERSMG